MFRRMTRERFLSDSELERFMAEVRQRHHKHQPRDHALFAVLANTGIRPSEALALTRGEVHAGARPPWMRVNRLQRKHAAAAVTDLILNRKVASVLATYLVTMPRSATLKLFPFTKRQCARLFHYYAQRASLPQHYRVYCLRHTVGMKLWKHTRDVRLIQAVMGHVRQKAAASYVHVPQSDIVAAQEAAGVLG